MSIFNDSRRYANDGSYDEWKSEVAWETEHEMRLDNAELISNERCENCLYCDEDDDGNLICYEFGEEVTSTGNCEIWEEKGDKA